MGAPLTFRRPPQIATTTPYSDADRHEHVHHWEDHVDRRFSHVHPMPVGDREPNATRPHAHSDGRHSHPHGHEDYPA